MGKPIREIDGELRAKLHDSAVRQITSAVPQEWIEERDGPTTFAPEVDGDEIERRLEGIEKICAGDRSAGSIAQLNQRARFHWLIAPRSTLLQVSSAHSGICDEPASTLDRLFHEQVYASK
ncbi:MAG: DUF3037 domain-containing protein [Acidobacteriaceae bacterium]|nr:DUF3037 domain-containing protein [Acidobacteriaceae bacterium]